MSIAIVFVIEHLYSATQRFRSVSFLGAATWNARELTQMGRGGSLVELVAVDRGSWVRIMCTLYSRHVGNLGKFFTHTQFPVALRRETPTQYPCCVYRVQSLRVILTKLRLRVNYA